MSIRFFLTGLLAALTFALPAVASPELIYTRKDWSVWQEKVNGDTVCFAATAATDKAPKSADHGDVWFYVTNWESGAARSQPSLKVGYNLREDLPSKARVGRSSWTMFGVEREAFTHDEDDPKLVRALKRGRELRVEAVSERNTQVTYHFSLSGSADAIDRAARQCG